ncbi:Retinol-binding protein 1 [Acipenser ruthenus]|uniref:Retinol-binding protein 1 n=1 Tax=Acipenser ruthenus TaxID=7906 RepID=A0A444UM49_ACIRT|nr:Retinol-binding protein 1 [Acipenser ruthenus]
MIIKTLSTFKNYVMDFEVGKEFEEDLSGVDDRKCMEIRVNGVVCKQVFKKVQQ